MSSSHDKNPKGSVKVAGYQVEPLFVAFLIKHWLVLGLTIQANIICIVEMLEIAYFAQRILSSYQDGSRKCSEVEACS